MEDLKRKLHKRFFVREFSKYSKPKKLQEVVYVTANPIVNLHFGGKFYRIYSTLDYGWDEKLCTVLPENVLKDALFARADNPGKKMIVHFLQPHCPFLGGEIPTENLIDPVREKALGRKDLSDPKKDITIMQPSLLIETGELKKEVVWYAYKNNLKIVLPYVQN